MIEPPEPQRLAQEFDDRNVVFQLALGLLSFGDQLRALLEEHAPESSGGTSPPVGPPDDVVAFVLGLIEFERRSRDLLEAECSAPADSAAVPASAFDPRGLLR